MQQRSHSCIVQNLRRLAVGLLGVALALAACQSKVAAPVTGPSAPTFKLDAASIVRNLASKPSRVWQDTMMTYPPLREQLKARQARHRRLLASSVGWSANLGSASSNAPVYAMQDPWYGGPNPLPNDVLYTLADRDKRAVGFKQSDGMEVPEAPSGFTFARQLPLAAIAGGG